MIYVDSISVYAACRSRVFRLSSKNQSAVGTYSKDVLENETFIHHTKHFHKKKISVPQVYIVSDDKQFYLQQDLGDVSLYSLIKQNGINDVVKNYLKEVLKQLAYLQIKGAEDFDFNKCYPIQEFDKSSMFWDLNSFKYYFARVARVHFSEPALNNDFNSLCDYLLEEKNQYFMFRDCQSRNVMQLRCCGKLAQKFRLTLKMNCLISTWKKCRN